MIYGPRVRYSIAPFTGPNPPPPLDRLEQLVPGAEVSAVYGRRYTRLRDLASPQASAARATPTRWDVSVALPGAWLVAPYVERLHPTVTALAGAEDATAWPIWRSLEEQEDTGAALLNEAVLRGELRGRAQCAYPYQLRGIAWAATMPATLVVVSPGGGKTLIGIGAAAAAQGDVLVVGPASSRRAWVKQVPRYATWEAHEIRAESERGKRYEALADYVARKRAAGQRSVVLVGAEILGDYVAEITASGLAPGVLIIDELHEFSDRKRFRALPTQSGGRTFEKRVTAATKRGAQARTTRAVALYEISRLGSIRHRIGLTATPSDKPEDAYAPVDLLWPGVFGTFGDYALRYCAANFGGQYAVTDGASNLDELEQRTRYFTMRVPVEESHRHVKRAILEVTWLGAPGTGKQEQNRPDPFAKELAALERKRDVRALGEARLAESCSRKREYVLDGARGRLAEGRKTLILTSRVEVAQRWGAMLAERTRCPVHVATGAESKKEIDAILDQFENDARPQAIVGTGYKIGTSYDEMKYAAYAYVAMLPWEATKFLQWFGRFDRIGSVGTIVEVVLAKGTYDEPMISKLIRRHDVLRELFDVGTIPGLADRLLGISDDPNDTAWMDDLFSLVDLKAADSVLGPEGEDG